MHFIEYSLCRRVYFCMVIIITIVDVQYSFYPHTRTVKKHGGGRGDVTAILASHVIEPSSVNIHAQLIRLR